MRIAGAMFLAALGLLLTQAGAQPAPKGAVRTGYTIRISEMANDLAVFEVFLPPAEANRKSLVHKVIDDSGVTVATEKFGTANGHYKVAMVGSFFAGRAYRLVIDGKYELKFVFDPSS